MIFRQFWRFGVLIQTTRAVSTLPQVLAMPRAVKKPAEKVGSMRKFLSPKAEVKEEPEEEQKEEVDLEPVKKELQEEQKPEVEESKPKRARKQIREVKMEDEEQEEESDDAKENKKKKPVKRQRKKKVSESSGDEKKPAAKKAKGKKTAGETEEQKELRLTVAKEVLATVGKSQKMLGYHVSMAGGIENAIYNAASTGCRSFALFVRNQRTWNAKPMEEERVVAWKKAMEETGFDVDQILPHGSYLMNPGTPDPEKLAKTRGAMLDECQRAERLGIKMYNFHPGSTTGDCTREECIATVAETINWVIEKTQFITLVIETMAGQGHTVGGTFQEIRSMIDQVKDKSRVGVCIDTCHIFAAGYDIRTQKAYDKTMKEFEETVGFNYLKAFHLNDSKGELGCNLDRHEHIGLGKIGKTGFQLLMNDSRLDNIPMVLETPEGKYPEEMMLMYGMDDLNKE